MSSHTDLRTAVTFAQLQKLQHDNLKERMSSVFSKSKRIMYLISFLFWSNERGSLNDNGFEKIHPNIYFVGLFVCLSKMLCFKVFHLQNFRNKRLPFLCHFSLGIYFYQKNYLY